MAIKDLINTAKNKVIDVASDVLSAPTRIKANLDAEAAARKTADIITVRKMKNVPDKGNYTDPLFRARMNVSGYNFDAEQARKKAATEKPTGDYQTDYAKRMSGKPTRF